MPASDISKLSVADNPRSVTAAQLARDSATREIQLQIRRGQLNKDDVLAVRKEWRHLYKSEYYRFYASMEDKQEKIVEIIMVDNPTARKFHGKHAIAHFSRTNLLIKVDQGNNIKICTYKFPVDDDISVETKEVFLSKWPGPLDRQDDQLKRKTTGYLDTLLTNDPERRIRYCSNDEQRKTILKLLMQLLRQSGSIEASEISRLLLSPEQVEIHKDEIGLQPLDKFQKFLLLGKRSEAIEYATNRRMWEHVFCLTLLDRYQPQSFNYYTRMIDDPIIRASDKYITCVENDILNVVYRALLNNILKNDPESIIKRPNVGNDAYQFAILSANDCEMDFDQTNEIFKLVIAIKRAAMPVSMSNSHLISLGFITKDTYDSLEEMSLNSILSVRQNDTHAARTHIISNVDHLIMNEIWEYCLNLARGTNNPSNYEYIIDLVPCKVLFAARLLDYGLYEMFGCYLESIKSALNKYEARKQANLVRDPFYDWDLIGQSVLHLSNIWENFRRNPFLSITSSPPMSPPTEPITFDPPPPMVVGHGDNLPLVYQQNYTEPQISRTSYPDPPSFQPRLPPTREETTDFNPEPEALEQEQHHNTPDYECHQRQSYHQAGFNQQHKPQNNQQQQQQLPQQQQPPHYHQPRQQQPLPPPPQQQQQQNHYQLPYNNNSNDTSRRQSLDVPPYSPPSYGQPNMSMPERNIKSMTSSSPVNNDRDFIQSNPSMADSFNAFSPIDDYYDLPRRDSDAIYTSQPQQLPHQQQQQLSSTGSANHNSSQGANNRAPPAGLSLSTAGRADQGPGGANRNDDISKSNDPQQAGFIANLAGSVRSLLPKSNSRQMILPDDSSKSIVYDDERKVWIDKTKPGGEDTLDLSEPPPVQSIKPSASYSFAPKSTKTRYPKAQF